MDFKTAIEHYQAGTATEEERLLVEEELDKFLLLEALVREDAPPGEPETEEPADFRVIRRGSASAAPCRPSPPFC